MPADDPALVDGALTAVAFGFDGLICDTEGCSFSATAEVYRLHGVEIGLEEWAGSVGRAGEDDWLGPLEALLGHELDRDELVALRRDLDAECRAHLTPNPGVVALMAEIRHEGLAVGVASSSSSIWVNEHLEQFGIAGMVDLTVGGDVVEARKPAPDVYAVLAAELGTEPARMLALEDSPPGVRAARAAGLVCVAVPNTITRHADLSEADAVLDTLEGVDLATLARVHRAARAMEPAPPPPT